MKRNIVTTIEFSKGVIAINVVEVLTSNNVEIYTDKGSIQNADAFLSKSIEAVESLIGGKIHDVIVVIEESKKINASIQLIRKSIEISNDIVSQKDVDNLVELAKKSDVIDAEKEISLIQPILFEVENETKKKYYKAPLERRGERVSATFVVTSIAKEVVEFVNDLIKPHNLNLTQILLKSQTISQNALSEIALSSGANLVHIGENQTFVTINKNMATVSSMTFYQVGYKQLLKEISENFSCDIEVARDLVSIYGIFDKSKRREQVIFTLQEGIKETRFTVYDLSVIISNFTNRILSLAQKYITQKKVHNLPVILSGKLTRVGDFKKFAKGIFTGPISLYKAMSFIEMNSSNHNSLGFIYWRRRLDETFGKQFNTIVETNPNLFESLKRTRTKKTFLSTMVDKFGGKYD